MSEELEAVEAAAETPTETGDVEVITPTPETEEPTDSSDAESEPALEADPAVTSLEEKLAKAEKKLAKTSYQERESKRREAQLMSMLEQSTKTKTTESSAPKIEDFDDLDSYMTASYKHMRSEERTAESAETANSPDPAFTQSQSDLFFEGAGKYDDFVEKVTSDQMTLTPIMANAIFEIEDMTAQVEVAYALAENPRKALEISRLSPMRQAAAIGKLEDNILNPRAAPKQASTAPKPVKPVGGSKTTSNEIQDVEEFESFMKKRNKQLGRG